MPTCLERMADQNVASFSCTAKRHTGVECQSARCHSVLECQRAKCHPVVECQSARCHSVLECQSARFWHLALGPDRPESKSSARVPGATRLSSARVPSATRLSSARVPDFGTW